MIYLILGIAVLAIVFNIASVNVIEYYQFNKNAKLIKDFKTHLHISKSLVVYFSRSGNTELMAHKISALKNANIYLLKAPDYEIGVRGWFNSMQDATKVIADLKSVRINTAAYDTIYIGAPIWLYSPAPVAFEFVNANDIKGKKIILFTSLNSMFDQKYIDNFAHFVEQKGGEFIKHIYVIRGRMTRQMDTPKFLAAVEDSLNK